LYFAGSESNYGSLTFDGVDVMGERLAKEVHMHTLSKYPIIISLLATVPEEIYSSLTIIFQCLPFGHKLIQFDLVGILL